MYNGIIKKSRTLDSLALLTGFNAMFPIILIYLPELGLGIKEMAVVNIIGNLILVILRFKTSTPVGKK